MPSAWGSGLSLIPKSDRGHRLIGLFPTLVRIWMRARSDIARMWEACNAMPCFFGGRSMGAQRASWMVAFRAEAAVRDRLHFGQSMLNLVKAFENKPHHHIVAAARRLTDS